MAMRLVGAAGVVALALVLGQPTAGASTFPQLVATGSSFAGVAITQWQGQFNEEFGGDINFTVSSSILGMNAFCQKTVDFGATDISYATGQSICSTSQVPYPFQYIPDVGESLAFEYNLSDTAGQRITNLTLNAPTLLGIFTGAITNWDDPAIQALNPDVALPSEPITAFYRSDPSGENYLLSAYLLALDPSPMTTFQQVAGVPTSPGTPSATWATFSNGIPAGFQSLHAVNGADSASQGPLHTDGGISYVETAYAKDVGLPVVSVVNASGNAVQPTAQSTTAALQRATLYSDLTEDLTGVFNNTSADAYPISGVSYFVAQCVPAQAAAQNFACDSAGPVTMGTSQGAELAQFITYVACGGQSQMANLGYAPLPPNLVEDVFQAAGRLPGGTTPPPPTPSNCPNPTLVGAPTITSVNPSSGRVGTVVALKGSNLDTATQVNFDGVAAAIRKDSATKIKVVVPAGARTGKIKVTTLGGQAKTSTKFTVT